MPPKPAILGAAVALLSACAYGQAQNDAPLRTTLCEIVKQPARFHGKLVEFRAAVEPGVQDLPAGVADESCSAEVKFLAPDDAHLARLLKSREFRKLTKALAKKPPVGATVSGWFVHEKSNSGLVLESVADVKVRRRKPAP